MDYLLDTNILLRYTNQSDPNYVTVRAAIGRLIGEGHTLQTTPQNLVEFWNVLSRPESKNGFGLGLEQVNHFLGLIETTFPVLPDSPAVYPTWRRLVNQFSVSGVQVHDARLAAFMVVNAVPFILTLNSKDFNRYRPARINPVSPDQVVNDTL